VKITKNTFVDLAIFMIGFGLFIGVVFPFFMLVLGIPKTYVNTIIFKASCIIAGVIVGAINILLVRVIVGSRIAKISEKMRFIGDKINQAKTIADLSECDDEDCRLPIDTQDHFGESARSYNTLLQALSEAIKAETAVRSFNDLMVNKLELELLAKSGVDYILNYLNAESGCVVIERGGEFFIPYSYGIKNVTEILENDNLWKYFENRKIQKLNIDSGLTTDALLLSYDPKEVHLFPLLYKDVPLGLLIIGSSKEISNRLIQTMGLFSQSFAISLNNSITYSQLQKLAANDPLTGLYNRRFGLSRLSDEFSRSVRTQIPLGVLMFDVDHFKRVNDTYGHAAGDRVLVNIAKIASMAARKGDIVVRYGGEEFVMILPGAGREDCQFVAERLRHMVEESVVQAGENQIRVTVSIGVASYPEYAVEDEQQLYKAADKALYRAKEGGRNIVMYAL
jgi:two-component system cell cycle response regulator